MSKSAIKSLTKAQEIMATAGVVVNLVGYISDKAVRKNWRNADALAALIIDSAANAFGSENSTTCEQNCFDNMAEAVSRYIDANLDDWNQKSAAFMKLDSETELARLSRNVELNAAFENREADHAQALEINAALEWANITPAQRELHNTRVLFGFEMTEKHDCASVFDACYAEALEMEEDRNNRGKAINCMAHALEMLTTEERTLVIDAAHAEALEVDGAVNDAVTLGTLHVHNDNLAHICIQQAVEHIRHTLVNQNRFNPRFIVTMMISVRRLAKLAREERKAKYVAMMANPPADDAILSEIPY